MRTSKIGLTVISLLLLLTGMSVGVKAQAIYGSIIGSVSDPRGAAVGGATVTVTDLTKNQTTTVQTKATTPSPT